MITQTVFLKLSFSKIGWVVYTFLHKAIQVYFVEIQTISSKS